MNKIQKAHAKYRLITGDFNYGLIDWESGFVEAPEDSEGHKFMETMDDMYLFQHVHYPARFREGCAPSRFDLVFTKDENEIDEIDIAEPLGESDHAVLIWGHQLSESLKVKNGRSKRLHFWKGDYSAMKTLLQMKDRHFLEEGT